MAHTALAAAFFSEIVQVHRLKKARQRNFKSTSNGPCHGAVNFYACHYSFFNWKRSTECYAPMEFLQRVSYWHWLGRNGVLRLCFQNVNGKTKKLNSTLCGYPHCTVKFLSDIPIVFQNGKFAGNLRSSPFNEDLSNEATFLIHIIGQHL
jgi:hypothetical protein